MKWLLPSLIFMKGLPTAVVCLFVAIMFKRLGLQNNDVMLLSAVSLLGWVLRPLWRPLIDITLSSRIWVLLSELLLGLFLYLLSVEIGQKGVINNSWIWLILYSCVGATHDVAVANYCIEQTNQMNLRNHSALHIICGILPIMLTLGLLIMIEGNMEVLTRQIDESWSLVFVILSIITIVFAVFHIIVLRKRVDRLPMSFVVRPNRWKRLFSRRLNNLVHRPQMINILIWLVLCLLPIMFYTVLSHIFLVERNSYGGLGLSPQDYSFVVGTIGISVFIFMVLLSRYLFRTFPYRFMLPISLNMLSLLPVSMLYLSMHTSAEWWIIVLIISVQAFGYAFGILAMRSVVAIISRGVYSSAHKGMIWAVVTAVFMLMIILSGTVQKAIGYENFFLLSSLLCIITLVSSIILTRYITHYYI